MEATSVIGRIEKLKRHRQRNGNQYPFKFGDKVVDVRRPHIIGRVQSVKCSDGLVGVLFNGKLTRTAPRHIMRAGYALALQRKSPRAVRRFTPMTRDEVIAAIAREYDMNLAFAASFLKRLAKTNGLTLEQAKKELSRKYRQQEREAAQKNATPAHAAPVAG